MLDFIRISCAVPAVRVGDVVKNTEEICRYAGKYSLSRLLGLYGCCQTVLDRLDANGSIGPCITGFVLQAKRI